MTNQEHPITPPPELVRQWLDTQRFFAAHWKPLMTDLTPNDLSHLSDEEFMALCPQGHHAPGPEPLSPAAQAVLDAFDAAALDYPNFRVEPMIAAALRAAADQVAPSDLDEPRNYLPMAMECQRIRAELLTIAAELEGASG